MRGYRYDLRQFLRWFNHAKGPARCEKLSALDLSNYRQHLIKIEGLRPASVNRRLEALRRFCRWAQQRKHLKTNIALDLRPVRMVRNTRPAGLTEPEGHTLLRVAGESGHGLTASLRNRVASAHVVLQRLANASPADRVAKALTALGRIVKTIYILRYIHEEDLRRRVQLQLNRGESRHALARWLFFGNRGEFRSGDYEEIMNKASCLSLLSNAVLVWNTMAIMKIVTQLRAAGETIPDEDLARISPLMHQHVFPTEPIILPVLTWETTVGEPVPQISQMYRGHREVSLGA